MQCNCTNNKNIQCCCKEEDMHTLSYMLQSWLVVLLEEMLERSVKIYNFYYLIFLDMDVNMRLSALTASV